MSTRFRWSRTALQVPGNEQQSGGRELSCAIALILDQRRHRPSCAICEKWVRLGADRAFGDFYRIYALAQRDNVDFNLAYIPATFDVPLPEPFDQPYMVELFKLGYEQGKAGYKWAKAPPGY